MGCTGWRVTPGCTGRGLELPLLELGFVGFGDRNIMSRLGTSVRLLIVNMSLVEGDCDPVTHRQH